MIIGLVGFIGAGKNTVGDLLSIKHGFHRESFSKPVKDIAALMFGWDRSLLEGDSEESRKFREIPDQWWSEKLGQTFSPRRALQLIGTECFREPVHPAIWVIAAEKRIDPTKDYVITDVRFPNEIEWIYKMGGHVIEIRKGETPDWWQTAINHNQYLKNPDKIWPVSYLNTPPVHISEWAWIGSKTSLIIKNDGTLDDLSDKVDKAVKWLNLQTSLLTSVGEFATISNYLTDEDFGNETIERNTGDSD